MGGALRPPRGEKKGLPSSNNKAGHGTAGPSEVAASPSPPSHVADNNSSIAPSHPSHVAGSSNSSSAAVADVPGNSSSRPAFMAANSPNLDQKSPHDDADLSPRMRQLVQAEVKRAFADILMQWAKWNDGDGQQQSVQDQQLRAHRGEEYIQDLENRLTNSLEIQQKLQEEVETLKPQRAAYTSGSFEDGAPSPPLLRDAHDSMQNALITCASKLAQNLKAELGGNHKILFASQLSECFFQDFETSSFGGTQTDWSKQATFQRPDKNLKQRLFQNYTDCKTIDPAMLLDSVPVFKTFCDSRFELFLQNKDVQAPFKSAELRQNSLSKQMKMKNGFSEGFIQVAKSVWLLHELAFACEPTAEIFRISPGCVYDAEYMEAYDGGDVPDNANDGEVARLVRSMAAPGLTLRNFIIKARVYVHRSSVSQTTA